MLSLLAAACTDLQISPFHTIALGCFPDDDAVLEASVDETLHKSTTKGPASPAFLQEDVNHPNQAAQPHNIPEKKAPVVLPLHLAVPFVQQKRKSKSEKGAYWLG